VHIHRLVVADPRDVDTKGCEALAGLQERPDVVGHRSNVRFLHRCSHDCFVYYGM